MKRKLMIAITVSAFLGILFDTILHVFVEPSVMLSVRLYLYFTIQSNLIVFFYFLLIIYDEKIDSGKYHTMFGGVLLYIFVTSSIFIIFLQSIFHPGGIGFFGSLFVHYITPLLVVVYFAMERENYNFKMEDIKLWIIFPVLYMVFIIIFGSITGDYLYPFFQIEMVGVIGIIISMVSLVAYFLTLSFLVVKMVSKE